jgi:uncharacterized protein YbjT (DUF2867 family)
MPDRTLFIAGASGVVGSALVPLAESRGVAVVPHIRPKPGRAPDPKAAALDLADTPALAEALKRCTTAVQLIGTMRKRFGAGDTYETSDIGTTRQLVLGAKAAGTIDHLVLLSSVGAGAPIGAYLKAKAEAEGIVKNSGIPFTIFRPSAFIGEGRNPPPGFGAITRLFGMKRYEPIAVSDLASAMLYSAVRRSPLGAILEGEDLWRLVDEARRG